MRIERNHHTSQSDAIDKLDDFLDKLTQSEFPSGMKIENPRKNWNGSQMDFSFRAKKSIFSQTLSGTIIVTGKKVILDCNIPDIVTTFVSEEKIREVINNQIDQIFNT